MKKLFLYLFIINFLGLSAQNSEEPLKIFVDCNFCDTTLMKQELKNVTFVRDQKDSDVHIFFTTQANANGGKSFEVEFIGKNESNKTTDSLFFDTHADMTDIEETNLILKYIRLGLVRFWVEKGLASKITVSIKDNDDKDEKDTKDAWNKWSFSLGVNGWFNGQETNKFHNFNARISGERIAEKNKFKFNMGVSQNKSVFIYEAEEIVSTKKSKYFYVSDVISFGEHWSAGVFSSSGNSLYSNYKFYTTLRPGIEYNFFPYSKSAKKQLILQYKIGPRYNQYYETTIFNKDKELLWNESFLAGTVFKKKWGSISAEFEYEHFLHDLSLDEFFIHLNTDIRIIKGLSLRLFGMYGITHNQINLSADGATLEEMLLQQQQIRSGYTYYGSVGLSYSFGSIYNTVVNPRFDF